LYNRASGSTPCGSSPGASKPTAKDRLTHALTITTDRRQPRLPGCPGQRALQVAHPPHRALPQLRVQHARPGAGLLARGPGGSHPAGAAGPLQTRPAARPARAQPLPAAVRPVPGFIQRHLDTLRAAQRRLRGHRAGLQLNRLHRPAGLAHPARAAGRPQAAGGAAQPAGLRPGAGGLQRGGLVAERARHPGRSAVRPHVRLLHADGARRRPARAEALVLAGCRFRAGFPAHADRQPGLWRRAARRRPPAG